VSIPPRTRQAILIPEDSHEPRARFNEPAGRQARLTEQGHSVARAKMVRLAGEIKRGADLVGNQDRVSHLAITIEVSRRAAALQVPARCVELLDKAAAVVQAGGRPIVPLPPARRPIQTALRP